MREIKFRAWDKPSKKMIFADEVVIKENGYDCVFKEEGYKFSVTDELNGELMQFTGLYDKNGKEIYEGDVIQFNWGENTEEGIVNTVVEFDRGMFVYNPLISKQVLRGKLWDQPHDWCNSRRFCGEYKYPLCRGFYGYGNCEEYISKGCITEVIGNIFEDPELLKP